VSVLAGGEWFSDPVDHASAADAASRVDVLAGLRPPTGLVDRVAAVWRGVSRRGGTGVGPTGPAGP
jgi:hypothetical protein